MKKLAFYCAHALMTKTVFTGQFRYRYSGMKTQTILYDDPLKITHYVKQLKFVKL